LHALEAVKVPEGALERALTVGLVTLEETRAARPKIASRDVGGLDPLSSAASLLPQPHRAGMGGGA
jgi:hypothetical protein